MKRRNAVTRKAAGVLFVIPGLLLLAGCCKFAAKRGGVFQCGPPAVSRFPECPTTPGVRPRPAGDGTFTCRVVKTTNVWWDPSRPYIYKTHLSPGPDCDDAIFGGPRRCGCYIPAGVQDSQGLYQWQGCASEKTK